jgi:hypothetical protein
VPRAWVAYPSELADLSRPQWRSKTHLFQKDALGPAVGEGDNAVHAPNPPTLFAAMAPPPTTEALAVAPSGPIEPIEPIEHVKPAEPGQLPSCLGATDLTNAAPAPCYRLHRPLPRPDADSHRLSSFRPAVQPPPWGARRASIPCTSYHPTITLYPSIRRRLPPPRLPDTTYTDPGLPLQPCPDTLLCSCCHNVSRQQAHRRPRRPQHKPPSRLAQRKRRRRPLRWLRLQFSRPRVR